MTNKRELLKNILTAYCSKGIGQKRLLKFIKTRKESEITPESLQDYFHLTQPQWDEASEKAIQVLNDCDHFSITPLLHSASEYPIALSKIEDAPIILYVKGNLKTLNKKSIAVIGTREPSKYSMKAAFELGYFFADKSFNIVSGLALGCDTEGHRGAIKASNGTTVAVLAHGLDSVYPATNRELADKILACNGALVSEYPPRTKPFRSFFVQRDRLQSGLSQATIVVQSKIDGGSMHTAKFCLTQNRILAACIPKSEEILDNFSGNISLINSKKALPIKSLENLIELDQSSTTAFDNIMRTNLPLLDSKLTHFSSEPKIITRKVVSKQLTFTEFI